MNAFGWACAALLAVVGFWSVGAYNRLMTLRNAITEAFAQFEKHLRERASLCDRLLAQVSAALPSEQATFDALVQAQSEALSAAQNARVRPWSPDSIGGLAVATALQAAAQTRLVSLLDHQAELRQAQALDPLLDELKLIERHRAFTRQVFNQAVEQYNDALRQMPTRLLTPLFGFRPARSL